MANSGTAVKPTDCEQMPKRTRFEDDEKNTFRKENETDSPNSEK